MKKKKENEIIALAMVAIEVNAKGERSMLTRMRLDRGVGPNDVANLHAGLCQLSKGALKEFEEMTSSPQGEQSQNNRLN